MSKMLNRFGLKIKLASFLLSILFCTSLFADSCSWNPISRNQLFIGPEIYRVNREKEGGSSQDGVLYGFRLGYDRIQRFRYYLGADFLYARGDLDGKTGGHKIKSMLTDMNAEGRFGYTIESKWGWEPSITPFIGGGYFWESNHYKHPSPLKIHFNNDFSYATAGFLSRLRVLSNMTIGLNFKVRYIIDGKIKISHDPQHDDHNQHYEEKLQYRVELPFMHYLSFCSYDIALSVVPFYEYRPYGHRANFPFDFLETKFKLYGATFKFMYLF
jgi:hypothetical protein